MRVFMQTLPTQDKTPSFYQLILQEDLLGGWSLIRQWGQMGKRGVHRKEYFDDRQAAQTALMDIRDQQMEKGFRVMFIHGAPTGDTE